MAVIEIHNTPILCWVCPCGWEYNIITDDDDDPHGAKEAIQHETDCGQRLKVTPSWRYPFIFVINDHVLD